MDKSNQKGSPSCSKSANTTPTEATRLVPTPQLNPVKSLSKMNEITANSNAFVVQTNQEIERIKKQYESAAKELKTKLQREEDKNFALTNKVTTQEREMESWKDFVHAERLVSGNLQNNIKGLNLFNYHLHTDLEGLRGEYAKSLEKSGNKMYWMAAQISKLKNDLQSAVKGKEELAVKVAELTSTCEQQTTEISELKKHSDDLALKLQEEENRRANDIAVLMHNNQVYQNRFKSMKDDLTRVSNFTYNKILDMNKIISLDVEDQQTSPKRKMIDEEHDGSNNKSKAQKIDDIGNENRHDLMQPGCSKPVETARSSSAGDVPLVSQFEEEVKR